jgi:hypothetical protein
VALPIETGAKADKQFAVLENSRRTRQLMPGNLRSAALALQENLQMGFCFRFSYFSFV